MVISMPGLLDAHYQAQFLVYTKQRSEKLALYTSHHSKEDVGEMVVATARTHFWVDFSGGCLEVTSLPAPQLPLTSPVHQRQELATAGAHRDTHLAPPPAASPSCARSSSSRRRRRRRQACGDGGP